MSKENRGQKLHKLQKTNQKKSRQKRIKQTTDPAKWQIKIINTDYTKAITKG